MAKTTKEIIDARKKIAKLCLTIAPIDIARINKTEYFSVISLCSFKIENSARFPKKITIESFVAKEKTEIRLGLSAIKVNTISFMFVLKLNPKMYFLIKNKVPMPKQAFKSWAVNCFHKSDSTLNIFQIFATVQWYNFG